eukprot:scaffold236_cov419-Prasinococcus_capsulatus_cf.AAC.31
MAARHCRAQPRPPVSRHAVQKRGTGIDRLRSWARDLAGAPGRGHDGPGGRRAPHGADVREGLLARSFAARARPAWREGRRQVHRTP